MTRLNEWLNSPATRTDWWWAMFVLGVVFGAVIIYMFSRC